MVTFMSYGPVGKGGHIPNQPKPGRGLQERRAPTTRIIKESEEYGARKRQVQDRVNGEERVLQFHLVAGKKKNKKFYGRDPDGKDDSHEVCSTRI